MPLGFYPHQPSNNQGRSSMRNGRTVRRQLPLHLLPHDRPLAFPAPSRPFQDEAAHARFAKFKDKPLMLEQGFVFTPKTQNAFDSGTLVIISSKIRMLLLHSLIFGCHINMANLAYDAIVVRVISRNHHMRKMLLPQPHLLHTKLTLQGGRGSKIQFPIEAATPSTPDKKAKGKGRLYLEKSFQHRPTLFTCPTMRIFLLWYPIDQLLLYLLYMILLDPLLCHGKLRPR
ncbi:hypothetical protein V6N12_044727 [Hibiscus sabdariffa]|uniref:Uncharacterized protein n=1 Tax=Hibiscus sabdariffa TaxID=183260 RepID=A0ABR2BBC1_9ROSI